MKLFKKILLSALIALPMISQAAQLPKEVRISWPIFRDPFSLGAGYDFKSEQAAGACALFPKLTTQRRGDMSVALSSDYDETTQELGLEAGGRFRAATVSGQAIAKFAQNSTETGYSVDLLYNLKSEYFEAMDTNNEAAELRPNKSMEEYLKTHRDPIDFWQRCGTHFVSSVSHLAGLYIKVSLRFSSKESAKKMEAEMKAAYKAGVTEAEVHAAIKSVEKHMGKHGAVEIMMIQLGGDPGLSGRILCPSAEDGKIGKCGKDVVYCGGGDFKACYDFIAGAFEYAAKNFSGQVSKDMNPINYVTNGTTLVPYFGGQAAFPAPPSDASTQLMKENVDTLNSEFENYFKSWLAVKQASRHSMPRPSARQAPVIEELFSGGEKFLKYISSAVDSCYNEGGEVCAKKVTGLTQERNRLFAAVAEKVKEVTGTQPKLVGEKDYAALVTEYVKPETYAQFCDLADEFHPGIAWAIHAIEKSFSGTGELEPPMGEPDLDPCGREAKFITQQSEISIDGNDVAVKGDAMDLRVFGTLTQLQSLKIRNGGVRELTPLLTLTKLKTLELNYNNISDICPLAGLANLQKVAFIDNKIKSLNCLQPSPSLVQIDARSNDNHLQCPSSRVTCKIDNLSGLLNHSGFASEFDLPAIGSAAVSLLSGKVLVIGGLTRENIDGKTWTDKISSAIFECDASNCVKVQDLNTPRAFATATRLNDGRVVIAGGLTKTVEIYDPRTRTKPEQIQATLSAPKSLHTATLLTPLEGMKGERVVFIGGYEDTQSSTFRQNKGSGTFDVLDVTSRNITQGKLQIGRAEHTATEIRPGVLQIIGGYRKEGMVDQTEQVYANQFRSITVDQPRLIQGRAGHVVILSRDKSRLTVFGGLTDTKDTKNTKKDKPKKKATDSIEILNLKTPTLEFALSEEVLSSARWGLEAVAVADGRYLLIGGTSSENFGTAYEPCVIKDPNAVPPVSDKRPIEPQKPEPAKEETVCIADSGTFGPGKRGGDALATARVDLYDDKEGTISGSHEMSKPRSGMVAAPVAFGNRHVLVVGGAGADPRLRDSAEVLVYK